MRMKKYLYFLSPQYYPCGADDLFYVSDKLFTYEELKSHVEKEKIDLKYRDWDDGCDVIILDLDTNEFEVKFLG